jgi:hypothetical protein
MKRKLVAILAIAVMGMAGTACAAKDKFDTSRGRGDAGVKSVDDLPKEIIQFPDRFSNVADGCDHHGHRVFVTTKSDQSRFMVVVADESCSQ